MTKSTWLQADRAYVCVGVVDVAPSETPTALSDRRIEHRGSKQVYIGKAIILEVVWGPLFQDISDGYMKENISAHGILRPRGQLCLSTTRYDQSTFSTIADILTIVQNWSAGALQRESNQMWDAIVIMKWVPIRQFGFSAPLAEHCAVAILEGRIFILLIHGHVWLEGWAGMTWSRWDLENDEYLRMQHSYK